MRAGSGRQLLLKLPRLQQQIFLQRRLVQAAGAGCVSPTAKLTAAGLSPVSCTHNEMTHAGRRKIGLQAPQAAV